MLYKQLVSDSISNDYDVPWVHQCCYLNKRNHHGCNLAYILYNFFNSIYSSVTDSYVECDKIYKFIQITSIILVKNEYPIQKKINLIVRGILLTHSTQLLSVLIVVNARE